MSNGEDYSVPAVWSWDEESGGTFGSINRPFSGATHQQDLPVGKHPLQLYSLGTPNGIKVTVLLEELLALGLFLTSFLKAISKIDVAIDA